MAPKKASVKEEKPPEPALPPPGTDSGDGTPVEGEVEGPPPPTFEEMWFDDPVEGREAQKLALQLKENVQLRAEPMRIFLEKSIVPLLLQGLQHLASARPTDPAEYLAAFLLKNNPRKDMVITQPIIVDPNATPPPEGEEAAAEDAPAAVEEKRASVAPPAKGKK